MVGHTADNFSLMRTQIDALNKQIAELSSTFAQQKDLDAYKRDGDNFWLLFCAVIVFFMQAGFAMLEAGSVRAKNTKNILLKNVLDACVGAIAWFAVGYGFAFGEAGDGNLFIGNTYFFLTNDFTDYKSWFFQFAFAATAASIVSGAIAERTSFIAYLLYATFLTGFVYPVVVHWVWHGKGWAAAGKDEKDADDLLFDVGMVDFAGCGVVHMVGGLAGLIGAHFVGPRKGRFSEDGKPTDIPGHSATLQVLGTFILWLGWYGFNPGSTLMIDGYGGVAAKTAVTTTMSAAGGGVTCLVVYRLLFDKQFDLGGSLNGVLAGLVSITSACSTVEPWAALVIGVIGGFVYVASSQMLLMLKIDDVVNASPVHYFCGIWGLIAVGLFATKENCIAAYDTPGVPGPNNDHYGLFYGGGGNILAANVVGAIAISAWVAAMMAPFFFICNSLKVLRVSVEEEMIGLDESKHGGAAYPDLVKPDSTKQAAAPPSLNGGKELAMKSASP